MTDQQFNRLNQETSPYLQQHATNPVEWYPWCHDALALARKLDRPILLSIGYSACHWCHVMAHESFEDTATAEIMNRLFINIKVDREERPDIDKIYQLAHQMLTQKPGGWPLNMFLSPNEHIPFFGGTYFPPQPRFNMPSFASILPQIADYYADKKEQLLQHNTTFIESIHSITSETPSDIPDIAILDQARSEIFEQYDSDNGGFGHAPKFPHPTHIELLLRFGSRSNPRDHGALEIAQNTLEKMALGGICDQIGGGFCRYSVDDRWNIPHFEKMLYDNGALLSLYTYAWQITCHSLFKRTAIAIAQWAIDEMQSPEGGFYSSLDADSEGVEGKFYAWEPPEVEKILDHTEFKLVQTYFGLDQPANFESKWHFFVAMPLAVAASECEITLNQANILLDSSIRKLQKYRDKRTHPGCDDKILGSWNALMIKGLATAGRVFERSDFIDSAQTALNFIRNKLWNGKRLLATYKDGKAHLNAYLDDYAYLIDAVIELSQIRWQSQNIKWAQQLADILLDSFEDPTHGGFYFTPNDHESLIYRPKPMIDEALPAGNGVAASALFRLSTILGETKYRDAAERTLKACATPLKRIPHAHCALLMALEDSRFSLELIVLRGPEMTAWQNSISREFSPRRICIAIPEDCVELPGQLKDRKTSNNTVAYICSASGCQPVLTELDDLHKALS